MDIVSSNLINFSATQFVINELYDAHYSTKHCVNSIEQQSEEYNEPYISEGFEKLEGRIDLPLSFNFEICQRLLLSS